VLRGQVRGKFGVLRQAAKGGSWPFMSPSMASRGSALFSRPRGAGAKEGIIWAYSRTERKRAPGGAGGQKVKRRAAFKKKEIIMEKTFLDFYRKS